MRQGVFHPWPCRLHGTARLRKARLHRLRDAEPSVGRRAQVERDRNRRGLAFYRSRRRDQDTRADESGDHIAEPAGQRYANHAQDEVGDNGTRDPQMMFMSTPMLLFMNISASHPAIPPMMIAASQPTPGFCIIFPFPRTAKWFGRGTFRANKFPAIQVPYTLRKRRVAAGNLMWRFGCRQLRCG